MGSVCADAVISHEGIEQVENQNVLGDVLEVDNASSSDEQLQNRREPGKSRSQKKREKREANRPKNAQKRKERRQRISREKGIARQAMYLVKIEKHHQTFFCKLQNSK